MVTPAMAANDSARFVAMNFRGNTFTDPGERLYCGDYSEIADPEAFAFFDTYDGVMTDKEAKDCANYIQALDVDVVANDDFTLDVTETFDVCFNEEATGFAHELLNSDMKDLCELDCVNVLSAPWTQTNDGVVIIGDGETMVTGLQRYVVEYTLRYFEDADDDCDTIVAVLTTSKKDMPIYNFTARLRLPYGVKPISKTLTLGEKDATAQDSVSMLYYDGVYYIKGNIELAADLA